MKAFWCYLRGFLEEGKPQSSARLIAVASTFGAILVGLIGVCRKWDSSMIVLALSGGSVGSLATRAKPAAEKPSEEAKG